MYTTYTENIMCEQNAIQCPLKNSTIVLEDSKIVHAWKKIVVKIMTVTQKITKSNYVCNVLLHYHYLAYTL